MEGICMNYVQEAYFSHLNNVMLPLGCLGKQALMFPRFSGSNKSKI